MTNSFFDVRLSIINKKKMDEESIIKYYSGFVTMRWLMNHHKAVWEANRLNSARGLKYIKPLIEYKALKGLISIPKNTFIQGDKIDKNYNVIIELIMQSYKTNKNTAIEYYKILGKEKVITLLEKNSRKNENYIDAKSLEKVKNIRAALTYMKRK